MKRLQISLEPELDRQLGRVAHDRGVSKAEVVRQSLRRSLEAPERVADDPLFGLRFKSGRPRQPGESIDDLIYGPARRRSQQTESG